MPRTRDAAIGCMLAAVAGLGGCKLIDQRTFDARAMRPPVPQVTPGPPGPPPVPPLAVVRFASPPETWQPQLVAVVRLALSRKPEALFRVQTLVPATGTPDAQATALAAAGKTGGRLVAETILSAGASSAQLEMTAMSDMSAPQPEVLVYVR